MSVLGHADGGPQSAAPPYHVRTVDFLFVMTQFDPDAARGSLPPSLRPHPTELGFMGLYSAPTGWGITPYTAYFVAVPVVGHDSPDGSPGYAMVEGYYSGRAGPIMHDHYNRRLLPGYSRQWNDGLDWFGEAGAGTTSLLRMRLRPEQPRPPTPLTAGVHHYLGEAHDGSINIYSVAFSGAFVPVTEVEIEIAQNASPMLRSLQPVATPYASVIAEAPLTFSPPRPITTSKVDMAVESARMTLLDVLARLGRPAALVARSGRVVFANAEAGEILAGALHGGRLRTWQRSEQSSLDRAVAITASSTAVSLTEPVALHAPHLNRVILAQALPVSPALVGEPSALLLFIDPSGKSLADPTSALELLGLTRAEARIAGLIGLGRSPKQAAAELGLTPNTVRSALKLSFDKLGISRQSELARVVARLAG